MIEGDNRMGWKKELIDYAEMLARAEKEDEDNKEGLVWMAPPEDCVDYTAEYRKQTGRDFETGELVSQ